MDLCWDILGVLKVSQEKSSQERQWIIIGSCRSSALYVEQEFSVDTSNILHLSLHPWRCCLSSAALLLLLHQLL
ncbi:ORF426 [White spot syndrome virus]|uniref:ORF426 n=1 Tax=White spot syndrome virus TaxID=342409 RepID=A0A2D3I6D2_9VIRU|nr:ORF426 [White spot syndrome virus]